MDALRAKLTALIDAVLEEAGSNVAFAERLKRALRTGARVADRKKPRLVKNTAKSSLRRRNRPRAPGVNPYALFILGEHRLCDALTRLDVQQLKDMVAEYGMDRSGLFRKWKSQDRLMDLIVSTVSARTKKGDVFRKEAAGSEQGSE